MLKWFYYLFIVLIAAIALLLLISVVPVPGNYEVLVVLSGSMEPTIKVGSVVVVKPSEDYKIDDIITFSRSEDSEVSTTHRIVEIEDEDGRVLYTVKGDINEDPDQDKVLKENVIGKVLFSIPFLGYPLNFAKQPVGFVLLIWIPALIIIWEEIKNIGKEMKRTREAKLEKAVLEEEKLNKKSPKEERKASIQEESVWADPLIIRPQPFYPEQGREREKKQITQAGPKKTLMRDITKEK